MIDSTFEVLSTMSGPTYMAIIVDPILIKDATSLLTFACLTLCGVLLWLSAANLSPRSVRTAALLLGISGLLHFLLFWYQGRPLHSSEIATGVAVFLLVVLLLIPVFLWKRRLRLQMQETEDSLEEAQGLLLREQYLLASLVNNLPDSIYFKDKESKFIRCNQRTAEVFGLSDPDDAIGKSDGDFFSKEEADEYRADEVAIMESGKAMINKEEYELWPDGKYHWVLSTKLPLRDAKGEVVGTFGLSRDISVLKQTEERLEAKIEELETLYARFTQEQALFSALIENIPDAVFFKDREHRFIRVNPAMARDAGFESPEEILNLTDADLWGNDLCEAARADEEKIMSTGEPLIGKEEEVTRVDGQARRWVLATKMPLRNPEGEIVGTFGLARDITTLKKTQQWLSDSQERFELAVQGSNDGLWDWNVATGHVWFSTRFRELLQIAADEKLDSLDDLLSRVHRDDLARVRGSIEGHVYSRKGHDEEFRLRLSTGEYHWFRGRGQAHWAEAGTPIRMVGSIQDIHDRHQAQAALARVKEQLQQALEGGNVGMWDWNILTDEVSVSPELMLQLGEDPGKPWTTLEDWSDRLHPDDAEAAKRRTWEYIEGITDEYESSFRLRHVDGNYRWILSRGRLFRSEDGQPGRLIGVHVDVTELREVQKALEVSEAKFRGIFNQTFQFIGVLDPDGEIVDANRTALEAAGVDAEQVIGHKFWDTAWWSHSPALQQRLKNAIARAAGGDFDRFEATHPTHDGTIAYVDFSVKPVTDDSGKVVYLIPEGRDISELKMFEQELLSRTAELESSNRELEQFAYVASHDLQEPLRTVIGFCQLLELEYKDRLEGDGTMYLDTIVQGGKRMQQLITDLLEYSRVGRRGKPFEPVDLNDVMDNVVALLHSSIVESDAVIEYGDLPVVKADLGQMTRLLQNVVGNSLKYRGNASPRVKIWTKETEQDLFLYISDNGIGIKKEFSEQIFIIFRRLHTREEYPGTGIGLAICRRIVERHGGSIRVVPPDSDNEDGGTTFEIVLSKDPTDNFPPR